MAKIITNINLDPVLKKEAQDLLKDLGMDLTTAVTIFLRQMVYQQGIPFEIKRRRYNRETLEALQEFQQMTEHPEQYPTYASFKEAMREVLE